MKIVAGLICDNAEFFGIDGVNHTVYGGKRILFNESPSHILSAVDNTIDDVDNACLDDWGIEGPDARRDQWATCNLSKYDSTPDYFAGQNFVQREFTECTKRLTCKYQGKLCRTQAQLSGLTETQLLILGDIELGLLDKEIAHKRRVKITTVKTHTKNIRIKTGLARKADMVRYAQKLNLNSQNNEQTTTFSANAY